MDFDISILPWWGWAICCASAFLFCRFILYVGDERSFLRKLIVIVFGTVTLICGAIGVVSYLKWAWT